MDSILRNYATPLSLVTFAAVAVTGIVLLLGLHSRLLMEVHEWIGVVFVAMLALHLVRNWRGLQMMLAAPRSKIAIGATGAIAAFLILASLPFGGGGDHHGFHGPQQVVYRLADAPIAKMAPALGLTSEQAIMRLQKAGVPVEGAHQSLNDIAAKRGDRLPRLLDLVLTEESTP